MNPYQGSLGAQLTALERIRAALGDEVPVIQTVFSPLAQAKNLAGEDRLLLHLRRYPDARRQGLETITETTVRFVETVRERGADGIFYAVQHARYGYMSEEGALRHLFHTKTQRHEVKNPRFILLSRTFVGPARRGSLTPSVVPQVSGATFGLLGVVGQVDNLSSYLRLFRLRADMNAFSFGLPGVLVSWCLCESISAYRNSYRCSTNDPNEKRRQS